MAQTFTDENIHDIIATGAPVVVDFWATYCAPCMALTPTIEKLAAEYEGRVIIGKYNTEDENDFAVENRIMSIPTLLFFKNGDKTKIRLNGSQSEETIREKIEELLSL